MNILTLTLLATAGYTFAQGLETTEPFTDPATGISFQAHTSVLGSKFGFALPKNGSTDLIGFLSAPNGYTYVGGVLGPTMNGTILIVAWPYGDTMMGSIRKVSEGKRPHSAPPEFSTNISLDVIPKGTFVEPSGDWQYTFLCRGCLNRADAYHASADKENFAWAVSNDPLTDPGNRTARLNHHHAGSGSFTADLVGARNDNFTLWAKSVSHR